MGSQGDAGQFRTPRHIIDMMVEITAPRKDETILDPACGTAGFLISAYKYIRSQNKDEEGNSTLSPDDKKRLMENFAGYDISPDMVRLSRVNMYLHGFVNPNISEYDTLTSEEKWTDYYDVIFANPPFMTPKGGITPHSRYRVSAKRSEVLFVDYIAEHLNPNGRAAIIVPEGIVFQSQTAYKNLRQFLVDEGYLYGVISLPAGVFNPYSGVKTSILLIDKALTKQKDSILFVKLNNDGFDLGAQRREIKGSEIPDVVNIFKDYQKGISVEGRENTVLAKKNEIAGQDYILVGERYLTTGEKESEWPIIRIGDVCEVIAGQSPDGQFYNDVCEGVPFYQGKTEFTDKYLGLPKKWTTQVTKMAKRYDIVMSVRAPVGPVNIVQGNICIGRGLAAIRCGQKASFEYLFYLLQSMQDSITGNTGAAFASINRKEIEDIQIPLPPLTVQEGIVAEIEGYQKIIDGARQVVENYKPTVKANPAWSTAKVGEVVDFISGVTLSVGDCIDPNGLPLITIADVTENGQINTSSIRKVNPGKSANFLRRGDLLFNWRNGSKDLVGKTALFDLDGEYIFASFLLGLRPNKEIIDSRFLWILLNQYRVEKKYLQFMRQNVNGLFNREELKDVIIPVPPLETQQVIIESVFEELSIIEQNKRLIEIFQQKIKDRIAEVWGE